MSTGYHHPSEGILCVLGSYQRPSQHEPLRGDYLETWIACFLSWSVVSNTRVEALVWEFGVAGMAQHCILSLRLTYDLAPYSALFSLL